MAGIGRFPNPLKGAETALSLEIARFPHPLKGWFPHPLKGDSAVLTHPLATETTKTTAKGDDACRTFNLDPIPP